MTETKSENIVYVLSKGTDHPEMVLIAFTHAVGALAMEVGAKLVLIGPAVNLAQKGMARRVKFHGLTPMDELLKNFIDMGGELYFCTPCVKGRDYDEKTDLIEQAKPISAAAITQMFLDAQAVVNY
jgi:uncharacterized protein involved in oxidation of intracellular sulfur